MLKRQLSILIVITMITTSCINSARLEVQTPLTPISKIVEFATLTSLSIPKKNSKDKEIEPNFKDKKLAYIYKYRKSLHVCEEDRFIPDYAERDSEVYQVNSQKYIVEFGCSSGAYASSKEFLLYSIKDYGIEIKPLTVLKRTDEDGMNLNSQPIWVHRKMVSGLLNFNPNTLDLRISTVRPSGGYIAEYRFDGDEFKLLKYSIVPDVSTQKKGVEPNIVYP